MILVQVFLTGWHESWSCTSVTHTNRELQIVFHSQKDKCPTMSPFCSDKTKNNVLGPVVYFSLLMVQTLNWLITLICKMLVFDIKSVETSRPTIVETSSYTGQF